MNYFSIQNKMFQDLPTEYTSCSLHIALERADSNKDWNSFKDYTPEKIMSIFKNIIDTL